MTICVLVRERFPGGYVGASVDVTGVEVVKLDVGEFMRKHGAAL
jgi:hypothetical protein